MTLTEVAPLAGPTPDDFSALVADTIRRLLPALVQADLDFAAASAAFIDFAAALPPRAEVTAAAALGALTECVTPTTSLFGFPILTMPRADWLAAHSPHGTPKPLPSGLLCPCGTIFLDLQHGE